VTGRYPAFASALQAWLPMKPAPPVTKMFNIFCESYFLNGLSFALSFPKAHSGAAAIFRNNLNSGFF
jgi:hypothetical protein